MDKLPEYFHFRVLGSVTEIKIQDVSDHDFVEVVRCCNCKYNAGARTWIDNDVTADCMNGHGYPSLDWFCADGVEKEEN